MLSVEVRINGTIIAAMCAHNVGRDFRLPDRHRYEYQCVRFPADCSGPAKTTHGFITHKQADGAEVLVSKVLGTLAEQQP